MSSKPSLTSLLAVWSVHNANLKRFKKSELQLRKQIETTLIEQELVPEEIGVFRVSLDNFYDAKITRKETRSFKYDEHKSKWLYQKLMNYYEGTDEAKSVMAQLFNTETVADIKGYDMLSDDLKKFVDESGMLEIKDGQSTLEIVDKAKPKFEG
jgi:hypothetical protein